MVATILLKRAYDKPDKSDGFRILVDRLWPRGIKKEDLHLDLWAKDLAPSTELRQWFAHDPSRWAEFRQRYRLELTRSHASRSVDQILDAAGNSKTITLLYGARDTEHNEAIILRSLFERVAKRRGA